jgi:drug efflux transport system permease protein
MSGVFSTGISLTVVEHPIPCLVEQQDQDMKLTLFEAGSLALARGDKRGKTAPVQLIIDGRNSNTALLALGYLRTILTDFNIDWLRQHGLAGPPAALQIRPWYNENLLSRWFTVPGIVGLLALVITTIVTGLSVAREREAGTFDQLLVTPLRPVEILIGKSIPGILIGLIEGTLILLVVVYWFELPLRGSLGALYLGMFLFLLSAVGIGLMISSLAVTQQQGILGAFLFLCAI